MVKSPNKILKLLVVAGILFSIEQLYDGVVSAADGPVSVQAPVSGEQIFSNDNIDAVWNGPTAATAFKTDRPWLVTYVMTYHYNGGMGQITGTIALKNEDGTMYGPWQASGRPDQGSQTNLYWECWPNVVINPGVYTVIDSHPASWSWNSRSVGGIAIIKGTPSVTGTSSTPRITPAGYYKLDLGVVVMRLASTYGPRQRPGTGLDTFTARLIRGDPVLVFKDIAARRDIVFVSDVVRALMMAVDRSMTPETVNIGSGRSVRIEEVVEALAEALGVRASLTYVPAPPGYEEIGVMDIDWVKKIWEEKGREGVTP